MATIQSGVPGHGDGTATIRLRHGKLIDKGGGQRAWDMTTIGPYEIICPACGDDPNQDWSEVSPKYRAIRGVYADAEDAKEALMDHLGMLRRR